MLKESLKKANMNPAQLAKEINISVSIINKYIYSDRNINGAKLETLIDISNVLNCRITEILTDEKLIAKLKNATI